jgi:hypothetical protein
LHLSLSFYKHVVLTFITTFVSPMADARRASPPVQQLLGSTAINTVLELLPLIIHSVELAPFRTGISPTLTIPHASLLPYSRLSYTTHLDQQTSSPSPPPLPLLIPPLTPHPCVNCSPVHGFSYRNGCYTEDPRVALPSRPGSSRRGHHLLFALGGVPREGLHRYVLDPTEPEEWIKNGGQRSTEEVGGRRGCETKVERKARKPGERRRERKWER